MFYLSESIVKHSTESLSADRVAAKSSLSVDQNSQENHKEEPDGDSKENFSIDPMCTNCPNLAPKR